MKSVLEPKRAGFQWSKSRLTQSFVLSGRFRMPSRFAVSLVMPAKYQLSISRDTTRMSLAESEGCVSRTFSLRDVAHGARSRSLVKRQEDPIERVSASILLISRLGTAGVFDDSHPKRQCEGLNNPFKEASVRRSLDENEQRFLSHRLCR